MRGWLIVALCLAGCATPPPRIEKPTMLPPWGYLDMIQREPDSMFAPETEKLERD